MSMLGLDYPVLLLRSIHEVVAVYVNIETIPSDIGVGNLTESRHDLHKVPNIVRSLMSGCSMTSMTVEISTPFQRCMIIS